MKKILTAAAVVALLMAGGSATASTVPDHQDAPHIERGTRHVRQMAAGGDAVRIAGADRYETAALVSSSVWQPIYTPTVFLVSGENFPDALATGASFAGSGPMLLTAPGYLPGPTASELNRLQPCVVVVVGGQPSVSQAVMDQASGFAHPDQAKCTS